MGSQVRAKCQCGLDKSISIGGGMRNFMTTCYFPCLCEHCNFVVVGNLLAPIQECPECKSQKMIPYSDPALCGTPGNNVVASWRFEKLPEGELKLTDGYYWCPWCQQMTLRFVPDGLCWD